MSAFIVSVLTVPMSMTFPSSTLAVIPSVENVGSSASLLSTAVWIDESMLTLSLVVEPLVVDPPAGGVTMIGAGCVAGAGC